MRGVMEPPAIMRIQQQVEQMRGLMEPPAIMRIQQQVEQMRGLMEPPAIMRIQEQMRALSQPDGLARIQEQVRTLVDPGLLRTVEQATVVQGGGEAPTSELQNAVAAWSSAAVAASAAASAETPQGEFGWIDLLPSVAQLKLLVPTCSVLNAALILLAYLEPGTIPTALLLTIEVLARLAQALVDRLPAES